MSLDEKRHQLIVDTLKEVTDSLNQVASIRSPSTAFELYFNAATAQMNYQVNLSISSGSINSGTMIITSNSAIFKQNTYSIRPFPLIFLHQAAAQSSILNREVVYISNHPELFNISVVDSFLDRANQISSIFTDPKFTEIDIRQFFVEQIPEHLTIHLVYKDFLFNAKFSGLIGANDILAPNLSNSNEFVRDVEKKFHHIIKALRYLKSDVLRWSIQE